jgi:hypothetical protein
MDCDRQMTVCHGTWRFRDVRRSWEGDRLGLMNQEFKCIKRPTEGRSWCPGVDDLIDEDEQESSESSDVDLVCI